MDSTAPEPGLDRYQERGEAGIDVNRRSPPEGGKDGRRDHVAAGGPRPRSDSRHQGATLQAAFGPLIGHQMVRPGGPTLMASGLPKGEHLRQCGSG